MKNSNSLDAATGALRKARLIMVTVALAGGFLTTQANAVPLWDNGPLVTDPGAGFGGNDASRLQAGESILGYGHQVASDNRVADDFTITDPGGWLIDSISFFAYQTGAPEAGTISGYDVQIWDGGAPGAGSMVASSSTVSSTGFSGVYRDFSGAPGDGNRAIQVSVIDFFGLALGPGAYWLAWQADGVLTSGPWAPPVSYAGAFNGLNPLGQAANGMQSIAGGAYNLVADSGSGTNDEFPFIIEGSAVAVPEPGTITLLGLGLACIGFGRRKKQI